MKNKYTSEEELCKDFIRSLGERWIVYPETCNYDIVIVEKETGLQIGIEAKLSLNIKVIAQASETYNCSIYGGRLPDFIAILVPEQRYNSDYLKVCDSLSLNIITAPNFRFSMLKETGAIDRLILPEVVPDVPCGVKSPLMLTDWKIKAIKIDIILKKIGFVTRKDFSHIGISMSMWSQRGWIKSRESKKWIRSDLMPDFSKIHPKNYSEIEENYEIWKNPNNGFIDNEKLL